MTDDSISALIREVLHEELQLINKTRRERTKEKAENKKIRWEKVAISSDEDLQHLVKKVVKVTQSEEGKRDIVEGNVVFYLDEVTKRKLQIGERAPEGTKSTTAKFEKGLLSERLVERFPPGTKVLFLGRKACTTPLARDRLRQRGISIERIE